MPGVISRRSQNLSLSVQMKSNMTTAEATAPDSSGHPASQCFVVVKYGGTLDLVDMEGQIKHLSLSADEYASDYVTGRETYVVIKVERQGENGPNKYIPLLNNLEETHPQLMVKLNNLSKPGAKNRRDRLKRTQNRTSRTNSSKPESKARPSSSERGSRSRQGK